MKHEWDDGTRWICVLRMVLRGFERDLEEFEIIEDGLDDHPDYSILEIGRNTEKSSGYLRKLVLSQTPLKDCQLTQVWKTSNKQNSNNNRWMLGTETKGIQQHMPLDGESDPLRILQETEIWTY